MGIAQTTPAISASGPLQTWSPRIGLNERTRSRGEVQAVETKLQEAGLRATRQRIDLGLVLFGNGDRHVTAEKLYDEAKSFKRPPSLATVYNTLNQFAKHGLLREIALYGGKLWYHTKTGPHFHFYIEDKDELVDVPDELIPLLEIVAPEGMQITGIDVVVRVKSKAITPTTALLVQDLVE
jgi:Fur family iron response transcriptional regulator